MTGSDPPATGPGAHFPRPLRPAWPLARQGHGGQRRLGLRAAGGHQHPAHLESEGTDRLLDPVEHRRVEHRVHRDLGQPVELRDVFAVDVTGEDAAQVVPGESSQHGRLVIRIVEGRAEREVLEQHHRHFGIQPPQVFVQPRQPVRPVVPGFLQHHGRVEADEMHTARIEGVRRGPELGPVKLFGRGVPADIVVAGRVADSTRQLAGNALFIPRVFVRLAGIGDISAMKDEIWVSLGNGGIDPGEPGRGLRAGHIHVGVRHDGEPERVSWRGESGMLPRFLDHADPPYLLNGVP